MSVKKIILLGSTGSIGTQALDVVARHPDRFEVVALVAGRNVELAAEQVRRFHIKKVGMARAEEAARLKEILKDPSVNIVAGDDDITALVGETPADLVISAIVGAAGLRPTLQAIRSGKNVALANKESLVIAGELMTSLAKQKGVELLPIDSEHSAVFQALVGNRRVDVKKIILTASGGPFLHKARESLENVSVEEALKHPNWSMGPKITIDSATLMNKGLEVIEASWFFDMPPDRVDVCVHPQSIVHSMVEYIDGSVMAQMGVPDMRCAISYAMAYPERVESGVASLDLVKIGTLNFYAPDIQKFPCLGLAYEALKAGHTMPAVLNAANEIAVDSFLKKRIPFLQIPRLVERTMEKYSNPPLRSLEDVVEADRWAREEAAK